MEITENTIVFNILEKYGDIADVMETLGVKSVGKYSMRRVITRFLTVKRAAIVHKVPLDDFLDRLNTAVQAKSESQGL
ncbi:MAG: DUF1858 domain-containing protein [Spirochaetales bacterium]|nr:DUF1858 domain-containing protein [Spirochaetales bacterium]